LSACAANGAVLFRQIKAGSMPAFSYPTTVIHEVYVEYGHPKFTLCRETGYSDPCLLHPPKGWINPLPVSGIFCPFFERLKKKPAIDTDAGFPALTQTICISRLHCYQRRKCVCP
jgi:hypothetical protein